MPTEVSARRRAYRTERTRPLNHQNTIRHSGTSPRRHTCHQAKPATPERACPPRRALIDGLRPDRSPDHDSLLDRSLVRCQHRPKPSRRRKFHLPREAAPHRYRHRRNSVMRCARPSYSRRSCRAGNPITGRPFRWPAPGIGRSDRPRGAGPISRRAPAPPPPRVRPRPVSASTPLPPTPLPPTRHFPPTPRLCPRSASVLAPFRARRFCALPPAGPSAERLGGDIRRRGRAPRPGSGSGGGIRWWGSRGGR